MCRKQIFLPGYGYREYWAGAKMPELILAIAVKTGAVMNAERELEQAIA